MGWWEAFDGTVIGDALADIVDGDLDVVVKKLVVEYPSISREQVLHTLAFCSGFVPHFDDGKEMTDDDKVLVVMTVGQRKEWREQHSIPPDMSKRIAPETDLMNVRNPFTGDVV